MVAFLSILFFVHRLQFFDRALFVSFSRRLGIFVLFRTLYVVNAYLLRHEVFVTALTDFLCSMLSGSLQKGLLFI